MPPARIRAPRGTSLTCKGWPQEAALRMLMNNLDPDVAERPDDLVVYGGSGKAARNWPAFDAIVRSLRSLEHDETLLVQSGKPVGVFQTHPGAPRVLIANALLVPAWATWENFRDLEDRGLTMYGQMTAGSWIYIGSQGIVQGTYETLAAVGPAAFRRHAVRQARRHRRARRHGRRPAARRRDERRRGARHRSRSAADCSGAWPPAISTKPTDESRRGAGARRAVDARRRSRESIGLRGNAADVLPALVARGVTPDVLTDQTSAHDALNGYVPERPHASTKPIRLRERNPQEYIARSMAAMAEHVRAMLALQQRGAVDVRLRQQHPRAGAPGRRRQRVRHSRLRARVHPAALLRGQGSVPLGGAVGRSGRHPRHRRGGARDVRPRRGARAAGSTWRASASRSRVCPRASCGSATASARASACGSTSWCAKGASRRRS